MFLGYRMKKRSMDAYDKILVPELKDYCPVPIEQSPLPARAKRPVRRALRAAACIVLTFTLIGVIVSNNITGPDNSFILTAYAASDTGITITDNDYRLGLKNYDMSAGFTMQKNVKTALPVVKLHIGKDAEGNNYCGSTDDFSIFEGADIIESSKHVEYSSGFQFSGDNIDSITMTSQNGRFIAYDFSAVQPITLKYAKIVDKGNGVSVYIIDDKDFSEHDKEFMDSHFKKGQTVTFPPAGYTAYWSYTIDNNAKTSDTIDITINYSDGSTQSNTLSISEDDNGNIVGELK